MRRTFLLLLILSACQTPKPPTLTTAPYDPDTGTVAIRCGLLIDGLADEPAADVTIHIRDGRFDAIGPRLDLSPAVPLLDLSELTCLPGLIDMHTHLSDRPGDTADLRVFFDRSEEEQLEISRRNAELTLRAGFTAVRNVGGYIGLSDLQLRDRVEAGEVLGPRMQAAAFYLTVPGGGGDLLVPGVPEEEIPGRVRMGVARGPEAFRERAEAAVAAGADVLKLIASGAVLAYGGVPGEPEMTPDEIEAVVAVARSAGLKVAAHAHGARSIREAIRAGADTIEHASLIDDVGIALAREHGVALSMDVYNGDYIATEGRRQGWPEEFLIKNDETTETQRESFRRALAAGVDIVYGTDSAVYPHGDNARQFEVMVRLGMTPMQAIRSATSLSARHMGWVDRVGAVEAGRFGDLIAVRGNPLEDIGVLERVEVVVKGGLLVHVAQASLPVIPSR